jgi:hypothetical protein
LVRLYELSFTEQDLDELADEFGEYAAEGIADLVDLQATPALLCEIAIEVSHAIRCTLDELPQSVASPQSSQCCPRDAGQNAPRLSERASLVANRLISLGSNLVAGARNRSLFAFERHRPLSVHDHQTTNRGAWVRICAPKFSVFKGLSFPNLEKMPTDL